MTIILTPAQAPVLARIADDAADALRLHQIGRDADVLVAWGALAEPRVLVRADGTTEPIARRPSRKAGRTRPE